jgi:hypothetical protein
VALLCCGVLVVNRDTALAFLSSLKTRIPFRGKKWNMSVFLASCSLLQHRQTFPTYLIVENDADERAVNVHATAVVVNEAELVSWLIFATTGIGLDSWPKLASNRRSRARRFSLELKW